MKERGVKMTGKVKWFNNEKGYGFIECPNLDDIFVHYSAISMDGFKTLNKNDLVEFQLLETSKGLQVLGIQRVKESVK